jgi:hypothetical protein
MHLQALQNHLRHRYLQWSYKMLDHNCSGSIFQDLRSEGNQDDKAVAYTKPEPQQLQETKIDNVNLIRGQARGSCFNK